MTGIEFKHIKLTGMSREEILEEAKLSPAEFMKGARRAGSGTDDQLKADTKRKNAGPGSGKIRQMARAELKRRGVPAA